jgi:mobilome CxxCx(11)CxxC protein
VAASPEAAQICTKCWQRAVDAFGTGKVFAERAKQYRWKLNVLAYLGIAVPASIGIAVLTYGVEARYLPFLIAIAGVLTVIQLFISILSVVNAWPVELEYANESAAENLALADKYESLGQTASHPPADLKLQFDRLVTQDEARSKQDSKRSLSEKVLRKAHRFGLRQYQRQCAGCKQSPIDMKSTNCGICGRISWISR